MSKETISPAVKFYDGLFNDCATACEAYGACGGHRNTMPCGCAWMPESGMRHQCKKCYLVCRDRKDVGVNGTNDFASHLFRGKMIEQISLQQSEDFRLPIFIPMYTHISGGHNNLPLRWAAVDVFTLFNSRRSRGAALKSKFESTNTTRDYLNISDECQLLGVLNGKDVHLESLWGMGEEQRIQAFRTLQEVGFSAITGATFSVAALTTTGTPTPFAHNVAMLMRQHKVVEEIQVSDLTAVPNMYWLDGDEREMKRWANWLMKNPQVHAVSRDFTLTKKPETALPKLAEMIHVLNLTGRSFHVTVVGTGATNGPLFLRELANAGHTGTIVTSSPIYDARRNAMKYSLANGQIVREKCVKTPFPELILNNLNVFEEALFFAVKNTAVEHRFMSNMLDGIIAKY